MIKNSSKNIRKSNNKNNKKSHTHSFVHLSVCPSIVLQMPKRNNPLGALFIYTYFEAINNGSHSAFSLSLCFASFVFSVWITKKIRIAAPNFIYGFLSEKWNLHSNVLINIKEIWMPKKEWFFSTTWWFQQHKSVVLMSPNINGKNGSHTSILRVIFFCWFTAFVWIRFFLLKLIWSHPSSMSFSQ